MGDLKLLWAPEHRTLLIASLVARLSSGGMPLLVLLWGYQYSNSWQAAGWAASAYALGALFTPWTGKWADRHGPSRVLAGCAFGMVICGVYLTFTQEWLLVWLLGVVGLSAAYPPITSSMRAYWMENQVADQIASAWESGVVRSSYCIMPVLVALGSTVLSYPLMLWIALTLNVFGIGIIVYKLSLRPHKQSFQPVRLSKSTTVLLIVSFMGGMVTGGLELWSPLVGQENNSAWLAGGLLSLLALGSLLGSFFYGARTRSSSKSLKRYIMAAIFMGLLSMILAFAKSPGLLLLGVLALGVSIGQLGAWGMTLMVQACPGAIREMMAWNVALAVMGIALAQALMGGAADSIGGLILLPIGLLTVWSGLILWLFTHWANLSIDGPSKPYSDQAILKIEHIAPVPSDEAFLNRASGEKEASSSI